MCPENICHSFIRCNQMCLRRASNPLSSLMFHARGSLSLRSVIHVCACSLTSSILWFMQHGPFTSGLRLLLPVLTPSVLLFCVLCNRVHLRHVCDSCCLCSNLASCYAVFYATGFIYFRSATLAACAHT